MKRLIEEAAIRRSSRPFRALIMSSLKSGSVIIISSLVSAGVQMSKIRVDPGRWRDGSVPVENLELLFHVRRVSRNSSGSRFSADESGPDV